MKRHVLVTVLTVLVYLFLVGPLVVIVGASFGTEEYLQFPPTGFTLKWFSNILKVGNFVPACVMSIEVALLATLIALLVGVPAAYAYSRHRFPGRSLVNVIFQSPVLIPGIVMGFVLMRYIIVQFDLPVFASLLVGHTLLCIPYVMRNVASALTNVDESMEEAAMSLGASRTRMLLSIVLPIVIVATKIDKVPKTRLAHQLALIRKDLQLRDNEKMFAFSSVSGQGADEVWKCLIPMFER